MPECLSVSVPGCQQLQMTTYLGLAQDALYSCTHMATVDVKGLNDDALSSVRLSPTSSINLLSAQGAAVLSHDVTTS